MLGFESNYVNFKLKDDQNRKQVRGGLLMRSMTGVAADHYPPRSHVFVLYKCVINSVVKQEVDKSFLLQTAV